MDNQEFKNSPSRWVAAIALVLLLAMISAGLVLAQTQENVIVVGSSIEGDTLFTEDIKQNNDGRCTLREAIIAANADDKSGGKPGECASGNGADVILLPPGHVYTLSRTDSGNENSSQTGDLDIDSDITIRPSEPGGLVVIQGDEGFNDRILHVLSEGKLTLDSVTIRGGNEKDRGGGIFNEGGVLDLTNVTLTGNTAQNIGGALYNTGVSTLNYVTVQGNFAAQGDALATEGGALNLNYSYIEDEACSGLITVGAGVENLAPANSGCFPIFSEDPTLALLPYDFDGDGAADYFTLPEGSRAIDIETAETACEIASPDPLGMERPQGVTCDLGANEVEEINVAPVANDQALTVPEDGYLPFTLDVSDANGNLDVGSFSLLSEPSNGLLTGPDDLLNMTYTPDTNFAGGDSFSYEICDTLDLCDTATVSITVTSDGYIEVTTSSDDSMPGSLRSAILRSNSEGSSETIIFSIGPDPCAPQTINLSGQLPPLSSPVTIHGKLLSDGSECPAPHITLDGGGQNISGITILDTAAGSQIRYLILQNFGGSGIVIGDFGAPSSGNIIAGNTISGSGFGDMQVTTPNGAELNDGITIVEGTGNQVDNNNIYDYAGQAVDLGADGPTDNDFGDPDIGANFVQNYPELYYVSLDGNVNGLFNSQPNQEYALQFFSSASCKDSDALTLLNETPVVVQTNSSGDAVISVKVASSFNPGTGVWVTATDAGKNTSEFSECVPASENNVVWTQAKTISFGQQTEQFLGTPGEARWYKFSVTPDSKITIDLTSLPANYDLTVYKDIAQTYAELVAANAGSDYDLDRIGSEFPSEVVASASFSPSAYTPSAYTPSAYTPSAYTPSAYTPSAYTPSAYTPSAYTQDVIAPSAYTPSAYTPSAYTPSAYTPSAYTPNPLLTDIDPALYSSAQMSSLIAVSAFDNTANESVTFNTWSNTGEYYVRVRGRNGASVADDGFLVMVKNVPGKCEGVDFNNLPGNLDGPNVLYENSADPDTVILVDWTRLSVYGGDPSTPGNDLYDLNQELLSLAARPEVDGAIVEIGQPGSLIHKLNEIAEAGNNYACAYAKNVVAEAVREVVNSYRAGNDDLSYVVIAGNDDIVPMVRIPDTALLGPESMFQPPVSVFTSSEASLRGNYVLTDDFYGSEYGISYKDASVPVIDLAVGRLVEHPRDMLAQLRAYQNLQDGIVSAPGGLKSLVTGYDFLVDAVVQVESELEKGTGIAPDTLITPASVAPLDPNPYPLGPWTANDLLNKLDNNDKNLIFLAGHFSASSALAADFQTGVTTRDILDLDGIWENVVVFSAGCHSGYNVVNQHGTPFTLQPDWASAFASRGAVLIGGTGYQYGDTDFLEYSERLYLYFTQQLRADTGAPVSIGQAMVAAKQQYLAETPQMRGIHQKALMEATVYGLPMLAFDMPGRSAASTPGSQIASLSDVQVKPGSDLGLRTASVDLTPDWTGALRIAELQSTNGGPPITVSWLTGADGVMTNIGEPALPLYSLNVAPPAADVANGYTLRGAGFRGGSYTDISEINGGLPVFPLIGAPATEIRAIHLNFLSAFWFPLRTWSVNLYDNLFNGADSATTLSLTPAQYKTDKLTAAQSGPPPSILRRYDSLSYRLYYSNYRSQAGENNPGLAAPPTIARVSAASSGDLVNIKAVVVGNPGAGIQEVWATYTAENGALYGAWQSVDLTQNGNDSRLWEGSFSISGTAAEDVRIIVQACSGTGLCSFVDNVGKYFRPDSDGATVPTSLLKPQTVGGISSQKVGDEVTFKSTLTAAGDGGPLAGQPVFFGLGTESRLGFTDDNGVAQATFLLVSSPGTYEVTAWFVGSSDYAASTSTELPFEVKQQSTILSWQTEASGPVTPVPGQPLPVVAKLRDGSAKNLELPEQAILLEVTPTTCGAGDGVVYKTVYTGLLGEAALGELDLAGGAYTVCATYRETPSYGPSSAQTTLIINNAPAAENDEYRATRAKDLIVVEPGVLGNDSDLDGDSLTAVLLSGPSEGMLIGGLADNGSFTYRAPEDVSVLQDSFTYKACDANGACSSAAVVTITINQPPDCGEVTVTTSNGFPTLWPVNKRTIDITLQGATDPDGDDAALVHYFETIWQDEPISDDGDAFITSDPLCTEAWVRANRDGGGDGRVYEIRYVVQDSEGDVCRGSVDIATLPHDQSGDANNIKGPLNATPSASCVVQLPPGS